MIERWEDPIVEEVRRIRDAHAAKFHYDLQAIFDDIERRERTSGRTYLSRNSDGKECWVRHGQVVDGPQTVAETNSRLAEMAR